MDKRTDTRKEGEVDIQTGGRTDIALEEICVFYTIIFFHEKFAVVFGGALIQLITLKHGGM
jgi:hypothetical protein